MNPANRLLGAVFGVSLNYISIDVDDLLHSASLPRGYAKAKNAAEIRQLAAAQEKLLKLRRELAERSSPHNLYRTTSGEVEARNVQFRAPRDAKARMTPPDWTEDVPRSKQHVIRR